MRLRELPDLTVGGVVQGWKDRYISPSPEYQRGLDWRLGQQQLLVDSALRGYPLPRFYFSVEETRDLLGKPVTRLEIVDGLQRIIAFAKYLDDAWPLLDPAKNRGRFPKSVADTRVPWAALRFSELSEELRAQLRDLVLPAVAVEALDSPDELRDLFIRLQSGTALTRQQVRDAWPGPMSAYIVRIAGKLDKVGRFEFLSHVDRRGSRRDDMDELEDPYHDGRQTAAQLMRLFMDRRQGFGIPSVDARALDELYHSQTDFDPAGTLAFDYERALKYTEWVVVRKARETTGRTPFKVTKVKLLALFLAITDLLGDSRIRIDRDIENVASCFWKTDWREAADYVHAGKSTSRGTIEGHFRWFVEHPLSQAGLVTLDPRRDFSAADQREILSRSDGACAICGLALGTGDVDFDHVQPWIKGGRTSADNGRVVHRSCNRRLGEAREAA